MTAPVSMAEDAPGHKTMQFFLPQEFDDISKIPIPVDSSIVIKEIKPTIGVVHRFSGSYDLESSKEKVGQLV